MIYDKEFKFLSTIFNLFSLLFIFNIFFIVFTLSNLLELDFFIYYKPNHFPISINHFTLEQ